MNELGKWLFVAGLLIGGHARPQLIGDSSVPPEQESAQAPAAYAAPQAAGNAVPAAAGKPGGWLIPAGYVFSILGGLFGILIGGYMWRSKEKLPSGEKVSRYDARSRRHGLIIFIIAIVMVIILKNMK